MIDFKIETDESAKVVICVAEGELNVENAVKISGANIEAYEKGYSVLYDLSRTKLSATIFDAYQFPRNRAALFGDANRMPRKIAVVHSADQNLDFWRFYEDTANNSGIPLKVFKSFDEALKWCG